MRLYTIQPITLSKLPSTSPLLSKPSLSLSPSAALLSRSFRLRNQLSRVPTSEERSSGAHQIFDEKHDAVITIEDVKAYDKNEFNETFANEGTKRELCDGGQGLSLDLLDKLNFDTDDTGSIVLYEGGAVVALWLTSAVIHVIDSKYLKEGEHVPVSFEGPFVSRRLTPWEYASNVQSMLVCKMHLVKSARKVFDKMIDRNLMFPSIHIADTKMESEASNVVLIGAGVGRLGIIDHDMVELSNMHRLIIHTKAFVGKPKVKFVAASCRSVNSFIQVVEHEEALRTSNALEILSKYDVIVYATDNALTLYMISDCCVVLRKPLVSGAALGLGRQLIVYNYMGGPCY